MALAGYKIKGIEETMLLDLAEFLEAISFPPLAEAFKILDSKGWRFFPVTTSRGRCYYRFQIISIPTWAFAKGTDYLTYYIAHEISHAFTPHADHGPAFMAKLISICPSDSIHHELGYKPRNAAAAGISYKTAKSLASIGIPD